MTDFEDIVSRIYEAAIMPQEWGNIIDKISGLLNCKGGLLFVNKPDRAAYVATKSLDHMFKEYIKEDWFGKTDRTRRLISKNHAGFVTDADIYTEAEFSQEPVFQKFFLRHGISSGVATSFSLPTGENLIFDLESSIENGAVSRESVAFLDTLRPHLCRSALLSARLDLEFARTAVDLLGRIGLPALTIGTRGQALAANDLCNDLIDRILHVGPKVSLANGASNKLFKDAIDAVSMGRSSGVCSIPVPACGDQNALAVHVLPIRHGAQDIFSSTAAIVVISEFSGKEPPSADLLVSLFDLTPSEARVTRGISSGLTVDQMAKRFGVADETIRTHLKSSMYKTGSHRQVDLARKVLAGIDCK